MPLLDSVSRAKTICLEFNMGWDNEYHYLDQPIEHDDDEYDDDEYTGRGSDDGYDAIKDANAEAGYAHDSRAGFYIARRRGWIRRRSEW
jgi:hypothetical protein